MDIHKTKRPIVLWVLFVWFCAFFCAIGCEKALCGQSLETGAPHWDRSKSLDQETSLRLRYRVLGDYLQLPNCPEKVLRTQVEQAKKRFFAIRQDTAMFRAIVQHLGLTSVRNFGPDEQFLVYREYKRLEAVQLEPAGGRVNFRIADLGQLSCIGSPGYPGSGLIDDKGNVIFQGNIGWPIFGVSVTSPQPGPLPSRGPELMDHPELRYMLLQHFGESIVCGSYRIPEASLEAKRARFRAMQQDSVPFHLLLQRLGVADAKELSDAQKATVFREYYELRRIQLAPLAQKFQFKVLVRDPKHSVRGIILFNVDGLIDVRGNITELKRTPNTASPCPK